MPNVFNDPAVEFNDIQGDVLIGLQKDYELFYFFEITDVPKFKHEMRTKIAARITSCELARTRESLLTARKRSGAGGRLSLPGLNIGFTARGLGKLTTDPLTTLDPSFLAGAAKRAGALHDPVDGTGKPSTWKQLNREYYPAPGVHGDADFDGERVDGVLLITGSDGAEVIALRDEIAAYIKLSTAEVYQELAHTRKPQRGHEHFGFLDGVSQPGIRGVDARFDPDASPDKGLPGQDLLWPGEFVFGYVGQAGPGEPNITKPGPVVAPPHPWMRNGSYMVFRRLKQLVPEFNAFVKTTAESHGIDEALAGARMVGRWKSGAPLVTSPLQDDPVLSEDLLRNNAFEYGDDSGARRCPFGAHIRKAYPRDDLNDAGGPGEAAVQTHRIKRAGIPFGPEVDDELEGEATIFDRGLMFVCYQTSIADQFEFVQRAWVNAANFPVQDGDNPQAIPRRYPDGTTISIPGEDVLIGQSARADRKRNFEEIVPNYPTGNAHRRCPVDTEFVVPTAAAYFFMPSISALVSALS